MTREREPFVSGLPVGDRSPAQQGPSPGAAEIARIRALARAESEWRAPGTVERFDGVERIPPDPKLIEEKATFDLVVKLCDLLGQHGRTVDVLKRLGGRS